MSYNVSWPKACIGCGIDGPNLEYFGRSWHSTERQQVSGRKVKHTSVSTSISAHLCPTCLDAANFYHQQNVKKYKTLTKLTPILSLTFSLFWLMLAFFIAIQNTYPLVYSVYGYSQILFSTSKNDSSLKEQKPIPSSSR